MTSVKFDSVELLNTTYLPRFVKHESAPERSLLAVNLQREDGSVLVSTRYGMKRIAVQGILVGSSLSDLETKIDAFKELFSREQKQLEISWAGGTRAYTATVSRHDFDRDHFHLLYVPWSAEFTVPDGLGYGAADSLTPGVHITTTTPYTGSFVMAGSKAAKPVITLTLYSLTWARTKGIQFKNTDTGEKIIVTIDDSWDAGDTVIIDCEAKEVRSTVQGTVRAVPFYGVFPTFRIGTNNFELTAGDIPFVSSEGASNTAQNLDVLTTKRLGQTFINPYTDATFRSLDLFLSKQGTPDNFTVTLETDDGNDKPDGSPLATFTFGPGVTGTPAWVRAYNSAKFTLNAGYKYWLVAKQTGGVLDGSNYWMISLGTATYAKGYSAVSTNTGATYGYKDGVRSAEDSDWLFRLNVGEGGETTQMDVAVAYDKAYL